MAAGALNWTLPAAQIARVLDVLRPVRVEAPARPRAAVAPARRGTPEIFFTKTIDNSRLVRVADPARTRELALFAVACAALFGLVMLYAWQHFSAVEYGYKIEQVRAERDAQVEVNRELRLEEAALRDPERIDQLARRMGLQSPAVGQVARIDEAPAEPAAQVLARATTENAEIAAAR